jgi:hypothetical protein
MSIRRLITTAIDSLTLPNTRSSTSNTTGALIVAGGAGIRGNLYATAVYAANYYYANSAPFVSGSTYTLPAATTSTLGGVIADGSTITVAANGRISASNTLPSQTGNSGKYLTTDGTNSSWSNVTTLPTQTANSGKFLTTNGTTASWANVSITPAAVSDQQNSSNGAFALPVGNTAQRPVSPNNGYMRYNTTTGFGEIYNASAAQWLSFGTAPTLSVEYLVVAGGGGGGGQVGGGGGGGGYLTGTFNPLTINTTYTVTVGAGGTGGYNTGGITQSGGTGSSSRFNTTSTVGGGGGGGYQGTYAVGSGGSGGGAGGGGDPNTVGRGIYPGSPYVSDTRQGYDGGTGYYASWGGGGGGGAGGAGANAIASNGGAGGIGLSNSISGTATYYAGGGGGCSDSSNPSAAGGLGGGGKGGSNSSSHRPVAGQTNTGGGGGGARDQGVNGANGADYAGAGGSGIVILSYSSNYTASFSGGLTASTTTSGLYRISTVTAGSGTVTFILT